MKTEISKLKADLDAIFSKFIRLKYADEHGWVNCFTCHKEFFWKDIQCGHWVARNYLATRWEVKNCRPQCRGCNLFAHGRPDDFAVNLRREKVKLEDLVQSKYTILKLDLNWYKEKIKQVTRAVNRLKKQKGL